jgi:hypothetical protein
VLQFLGAAGADGAAGGIAWWAHVGGFLAGIVLLKGFERIPATGMSAPLEAAAARKHSHHLQVIRPAPISGSPDLRGRLRITAFEALAGTRKRVALANGLRRRTFLVSVPPGIKADQSLRLRGLGQKRPDGRRGDLYLTIELESW